MKKITAFLALATAFFASSCFGDVIDVSNLTSISDNGRNMGLFSIYVPITVGSDASAASSINSITLGIDASGSATLTAYIYAYNSAGTLGTTVGSLVSTIGSTNVASGATLATFSVSGLSLSTNTTYYLYVASSSSSILENAASSQILTGLVGWSIGSQLFYIDGDWGEDTEAFSLVSITSSGNAVPEPATYAGFAGLGALALAFAARRRNSRRS